MPVLTSTLGVAVTPTQRTISVTVTGGEVILEARGSATAPWVVVGTVRSFALVDNPVPGTQYRVQALTGSPTFEVNE